MASASGTSPTARSHHEACTETNPVSRQMNIKNGMTKNGTDIAPFISISPFPSSIEDATGAPADEQTHDGSSSELEFLAALESEPAPLKRDREARTTRTPQPLLSSSSGPAGRAPLSGLDVLQALQHKAAARRKGGGWEGDRGTRRGARGGGGGGEGHSDVRDYSNVRPLDIKSDWGTRLDELDRLVQELQAQQHLYSD